MMFLIGSLFSLVGLTLPYFKNKENIEKDSTSIIISLLGAGMFIMSGVAGLVYVSWSWILILIGIVLLLIQGIKIFSTLRY